MSVAIRTYTVCAKAECFS